MKKSNLMPSIFGFAVLFIVIPLLYVGVFIIYTQFNEQWDRVETAMLSMFCYYIACSVWWFLYSLRKRKQLINN